VLFFGGCAPGTTITLDTRRTHYEELTLLGAFHHTPDTIRRAVEMLATGALVPDSLISHRMPLEEVGHALALMAKGEALKVLIRP
jgi:L-iditol 2-dehydrogenase